MKKQIEQLIDKLSDKSLTFGCRFKYPEQWRQDELLLCAIYDDTGNTKTLSFLPPSKEMTFEINDFNGVEVKEIMGHPILIGDVLERMRNDSCKHMSNAHFGGACADLCLLWEKCGFTKSIQDLSDESEWVSVRKHDDPRVEIELNERGYLIKAPKQKHIRELFEHLLSL
jgi:hypothetical protein